MSEEKSVHSNSFNFEEISQRELSSDKTRPNNAEPEFQLPQNSYSTTYKLDCLHIAAFLRCPLHHSAAIVEPGSPHGTHAGIVSVVGIMFPTELYSLLMLGFCASYSLGWVVSNERN